MTNQVQSFQYGGHKYSFNVNKCLLEAEKVKIHVNPDGSIDVDAPKSADDMTVLKAVKKRARWIHNHVGSFKEGLSQVLAREYISGETIFYLGKRYQLKVVEDELTEAVLKNGKLYIKACENIQQRKVCVDNWHRAKAKQYFSKRLEVILSKLSWVQKTPPLTLRLMKTQWGSCSVKGNIMLNPQLIKAPAECIDYVILHELCHLKEHNHSPEFYKLLSTHMPEWKGVKAKLDAMSELILNEA